MMRCSLPLLLTSIFSSHVLIQGYNLSEYRLPTKTYPLKYYLTLDLTKPELDTYYAKSWIYMNVTEKNTYDFTFNVNPEYINLTTMDLKVNTAHFICELEDSNKVTQLMGVSCIYDMSGSNTPINMYYHAKYSTANSGGGLVREKFTVNDTDSWVIYTQFQPTYFRRVFPSFDEPAFKTPMYLFVEHHPNLITISNMDLLQKGYSLQSTSFKATPKMSTYLLAMVAGPNDTWREYFSPQNRNYNFSMFAQRIFEDNLSIVMDAGPKLLDLMGTWTGLSYETLGNTKMTFAAIPGKEQGMENWGLLTFGEAIIIDEGSRTTEKSIENCLTIVANVLAHQWFGNYVTLTWWSELWINEGFGRYFQYYLAHMLSKDFGFDKTFVIVILQDALHADRADMIPLSNNDENVNSEQEILDDFNKNFEIPYNKGASVLRMIRHALGNAVFQKACQNYLKKNALGSTRSSDFIQQLQNALSSETQQPDLSVYLDAWIHHPGYPVLKTSLSKDKSGNITITINVYKFNTTEDSIWYVPLTYVLSENPDKVETAWIKPGSSFHYTLSGSNNSWSVINADARGFYRVEYDSELISMIVKVLNNSLTYENISVLSRAQIIDDIFAFATVKKSYETAFLVASYLKYEKEYYPWYSFLQQIIWLLENVENATEIKSINNKVLDLVESQLVIPQGQSSKKFSHSEILKQNLLLDWAARLNQIDALQYIKSQYLNFKKNNTSIDNDFRDVIICYGITTSDNPSKEYNDMSSLYKSVVNPQQKKDVATGLSCLKNEKRLA